MPEVTPDQYPDILERAADILESEQVNWCQGKYFTGPMEQPPLSACALGSIRMSLAMANGNLKSSRLGLLDAAPQWLNEVADDIDAVLGDYLDKNVSIDHDFHNYRGWGGIAAYNDVSYRTKAEVVDVMKRAAKDLRNAANQ